MPIRLDIQNKEFCIAPSNKFTIIVVEAQCLDEFQVSLVLVVYGKAADHIFLIDAC